MEKSPFTDESSSQVTLPAHLITRSGTIDTGVVLSPERNVGAVPSERVRGMSRLGVEQQG